MVLSPCGASDSGLDSGAEADSGLDSEADSDSDLEGCKLLGRLQARGQVGLASVFPHPRGDLLAAFWTQNASTQASFGESRYCIRSWKMEKLT